ncbi:MAG: hypothetical protein JSU66_14980 [Deltaproteobacteria bacterium]|nr:MAG: hypothetical protein JSU66_14980 [Deltaproteobacteria bacterium]
MTRNDDGRPRLGREEQAFVERLGTHYAPTPRTPAERVAFDEALSARVERPRRGRLLVATAAAAAAAALFWFVAVPSSGPPGNGAAGAVAARWETELFLSSDLSAAAARDEGAMLPEEYQAIALAFLDG